MSWLKSVTFSATVSSLLLNGCVLQKVDPNARAATSIDPKFAQSEYWFNQPAVEKIRAADYDQLWNACEASATDVGFGLDRFDYRTGFLSTKPLVSKQFFEFWRGDIVDSHSQADSDTSTHRRTANFKIRRLDDGKYECEVKVVVEHYSMPERRITSVVQYQDAFSTHRQYESRSTDDGQPLRVDYWYAERRDGPLERSLADRIRGYLDGRLKIYRVVVDADSKGG